MSTSRFFAVIWASDEPAQRRRDRILLWIGVLLALVLIVRAARKQDGVLVKNQEFGARFLAREDPYFDPASGARVHGPYPPSYALVTAPLSLLPRTAARVVWASAQIAALVACYFASRRIARRAWPVLAPHTSVLFVIALLLASRWILRDMAGGGGNLLYATSAVWGIVLAFENRERLGGVFVALPLVLKPNLAPLLAVLLLRKRFRALGVALATALVLFWLPAIPFGVASYAELSRRWFVDVEHFEDVENTSDAAQVPEGFPVTDTSMNQSLRAAIERVADGFGDVDSPERARNGAVWTARVLAAFLFALGAVVVLRARGARAEILAALAFLPLCLLVSPITWKAHHAALLPLFFTLACAAIAPRRSWLVFLLVAYYLLCDMLSEEIVGKALKNRLQEWSIVTWFDVALFVVALVVASRETAANEVILGDVGTVHA